MGSARDGRVVLEATYSPAGLTVGLPRGWRVVQRRLTPCTDPVEVITLSGRGALVQLQEALPPYRALNRFAPRPRAFPLDGEAEWIACCAPSKRREWFSNFRDGGRGFYPYVYLGKPGTRAEAHALLDSLQVLAVRVS